MVKPAIPIKYREGDPLEPDFWDKIAKILKYKVYVKGVQEDYAHDYVIREIWGTCAYDRVMRPSEGDVVVDAGAHIGAFTVRASQMVGESGKVYAFEPYPESFSYLRLNTEKLKNVQIFEIALWSSETTKTLYLAGNSGGHSLIDNLYEISPVDRSDYKSSISVPTTCLDKIVAGKVDFMKIDVECSELEILKGAACILENYHPFIAIEIHTVPLVNEVGSFLAKYGYKRGPPSPVFTYWTEPMTTTWGH